MRKQTGFGLLELLIAIAIGVFVLGGAISLMVGSKTTQRAAQDVASAQDDVRASAALLAECLKHAGLPAELNIEPVNASASSDTAMMIRYIGDSDCMGNTVTDTRTITHTLAVSGTNLLWSSNLRPNPEAIISSVDRFIVAYGLDATTYLAYDDVTDWSRIVSVRITLTVIEGDAEVDVIVTQPFNNKLTEI